ncbi:acetyltransferase [Pseudomonas oryzihabitans]|uniref:acetyltransferase n=1 Tax=Pseudomonas oryzihabitans TaxID=47885 RepID=UPI00241DFE2D|nr:acetyltransferase [Pseudomonas oryzihabitans]
MKIPLVIIGDGLFADIAYEYFTHDSSYHVVAFSVDQDYLRSSKKFGLPVIPFNRLTEYFSDTATRPHFYAAITYGQLNRTRERFYREAKAMGFLAASYISSNAFVWRNVVVGEHCFIFENNTVQPFVILGDNVVLWSGNHIGHHSVIGNHVFVASQAVISGNCRIGDHQFIGVNATLVNDVALADDVLVGAGALVTRSVATDQIAKGVAATNVAGAKRYFKVEHE